MELNLVERSVSNRKTDLKRLYGISIIDYNVMLAAQDNKCAICNTHISQLTKRLHVDHDHNTGKIRGLLCSKCNTGIGMLNDDVAILEKAILYLKGEYSQ